MEKREKGNALIISDPHGPYEHPDILDFLSDVKRGWACTRTYCVGDEVDFHRISRHIPEPDSMGPKQEFEAAKLFIKKLAKLFPVMKLCTSNHGARPMKLAKQVGIPSFMLRDIGELLEAPKTWEWAHHWIMDNNVMIFHGEGYGGPSGALNAAMHNRMSVAMGHLHSFGGVTYSSNGQNQIFGLNTGFLADDTSPAMRYGAESKTKGTLGCGVIVEGGKEAYFVPMG